MRKLLLAVLAIALAVVLWRFHAGSHPARETALESSSEAQAPFQAQARPAEAQTPAHREVREAARDAGEAAAEDTARAYVALAKPDLKTYRDEARRNPHHAPAALMRLADQMAVRMEKAKASQDYAAAFFKDLKACATDASPDGVQTVRAICAVNAGRLADLYPGRLGDEFREFRRGLPENISTLVSASGY